MKLWVVACLVLVLTGCTVGYRHTRHNGKIARPAGELKTEGSGNTLDLGVAFDFRYFRFGMPFEAGRRLLTFTAPNGGKDTLDLIRERRFYRLDVPVLSLWDFEHKKFGGYPGLMRHRNSFELWISGESDLNVEHEWWLDLGFVFYKYKSIMLRFYLGGGALPFDAATPVPGTRFPGVWRGSAPTYGGGLSLTVVAGEFGLDAIEYLLGIDDRHRKRAERQNPGR